MYLYRPVTFRSASRSNVDVKDAKMPTSFLGSNSAAHGSICYKWMGISENRSRPQETAVDLSRPQGAPQSTEGELQSNRRRRQATAGDRIDDRSRPHENPRRPHYHYVRVVRKEQGGRRTRRRRRRGVWGWSSAEGARIEAPSGWGVGGGAPLPIEGGVWGAVPPPQKIFWHWNSKWRVLVHSGCYFYHFSCLWDPVPIYLSNHAIWDFEWCRPFADFFCTCTGSEPPPHKLEGLGAL